MICIVSHDAGGAEILASYAKQNHRSWLFSLAGPAEKVFAGKMGKVESLPFEDAIEKADEVLCGTSWQSDLEWQAIALSRKMGKRSVAFLDHWVNYQERFVRADVQHLPDEIWVGDVHAEALASAEFPGIPIRLVPNPHFVDIRNQVANLKVASKKPAHSNLQDCKVLFVCENISEHAQMQHGDPRFWGYTEFDAIEYFFANIKALQTLIATVTIRPHPSDPAGKYDHVIDKHLELAHLSSGQPLLADIAAADVVVGCESMAMVIAVQCGRRVVSCIPLQQVALKLPFSEIEILSTLVRNHGK
jgi:hypothetical protein